MFMTQAETPDWRKLTDAAPLVGVSASKLSRMARDGKIATRQDPRDERVVLVDLTELKRRFNVS
jgi:DNA-binding MarR family transcriptional regulator